MLLDLGHDGLVVLVGWVPEDPVELGTVGEVGGERHAWIGAEDARHDVEEPGREVGVALREPPLALEVLQGAHDLDALLERVHADRVALPSRPDRERPVGGVGRLAGHGRLEPAEPGRRGRDRERARRVGGLGDDGGVGAEAGLDAGEGAERDLGRLLADDRVQLQVAGEPDSGVRERPGREPHGDGRGLHVGRAEPVEAPVDDLRAPGAAADPLARDRRHGVDVAVEDQRAPASGARPDADEVDSIGVLGDPVGG